MVLPLFLSIQMLQLLLAGEMDISVHVRIFLRYFSD